MAKYLLYFSKIGLHPFLSNWPGQITSHVTSTPLQIIVGVGTPLGEVEVGAIGCIGFTSGLGLLYRAEIRIIINSRIVKLRPTGRNKMLGGVEILPDGRHLGCDAAAGTDRISVTDLQKGIISIIQDLDLEDRLAPAVAAGGPRRGLIGDKIEVPIGSELLEGVGKRQGAAVGLVRIYS